MPYPIALRNSTCAFDFLTMEGTRRGDFRRTPGSISVPLARLCLVAYGVVGVALFCAPAWGQEIIRPKSSFEVTRGVQTGTGVAPQWTAGCPVTDAPTDEPTPIRKNRYLSLQPGNAGIQVALQVELIASEYFPACVGIKKWVGPPDAATGIVRLQDVPEYRDWSLDPTVIHVGDVEIVPVASYEVRAIALGCDTAEPLNFSAALAVSTIDRPGFEFWGDCVGLFSGTWPGPDGVVNFDDIVAMVQLFNETANAPPIVQMDLAGARPDGVLNYDDIFWVVRAFDSQPYPFQSPCGAVGQTARVAEQQAPALMSCTLAHDTVVVGTTEEFTIFLGDAANLGAYQTQVRITPVGTAIDGGLYIGCPPPPPPPPPGVEVYTTDGRFVFLPVGIRDVTRSCPTRRLGAMTAVGVGVTVPASPPGYVATYALTVNNTAVPGTEYRVAIVPSREPYNSPLAPREESFVRDSSGLPLPMSTGSECLLRIAVDCQTVGVVGHGVPDICDVTHPGNCSSVSGCRGYVCGTSADCDADLRPDECETDFDADTVIDDCDNCPMVSNQSQFDTDSDGVGNNCDSCQSVPNPMLVSDGTLPCAPAAGEMWQLDSDCDDFGDPCDKCPGFDDALDADFDTIPDGCDVCAGGDDRVDCDRDFIPNRCEIRTSDQGLCTGPDCSTDCLTFQGPVTIGPDGMPDECQIACGETCHFLPDTAGIDSPTVEGAFEILLLDGTSMSVSVGGGGSTLISRGIPHSHGDAFDLNASDEPCAPPVDFLANPSVGRETHVAIGNMELSNGAVTVRAGQAYFATVSGSSRQTWYQDTLGEVQGTCFDFPAESFFDLFMEIDTGTMKLYNKSPVVVRAAIADLGWTFPTAASIFVNAPATPAVPLVDESGVQRGYLQRAQLGRAARFLPAQALGCRTSPGLGAPLSFVIDVDTTGLPVGSSPDPNDVRSDAPLLRKKVTVYQAPGDPSTAGPNLTNMRDNTLTGNAPAEFTSGNAIRSLSFGRDGSGVTSTDRTSPAIVFSVAPSARGTACSDVSSEAPDPLASPADGDRVAADLFVAQAGPFGTYNGPVLPWCDSNHGNCLIADQTVLGLGPLVSGGAGASDNLVALELSEFNPTSGLAYLTFDQPSFGGDSATIFVFDPLNGPFRPSSLRTFAAAANLGLASADEIDALAVSDVSPLGQWSAGDEVLFSLTPGSPVAVANGWSGAHVFKVMFGQAAGLGPGNIYMDPSDLHTSADDVDAIDVAVMVLADCNNNGLEDRCEIALGLSEDGESDGIPDECEDKNRYVTVPPNVLPAGARAIRVELITLMQPNPPNIPQNPPPDFSAFHGKTRYVNLVRMCRGGAEPGTVICRGQAECDARGLGGSCEQMHTCQGGSEPGGIPCGGSGDCDGRGRGGVCAPSIICRDSESLETTFRCAVVDCDPEYYDWGTELGGAALHVTGSVVVPSSLYHVRTLAASCQGNEDVCLDVSQTIVVKTSRWGDTGAPFQRAAPMALAQPNVLDIAGEVDKVKDLLTGVLIKQRAQLQPNRPNPMANVNVLDIANVVDAVKGIEYRFPGPEPCASD